MTMSKNRKSQTHEHGRQNKLSEGGRTKSAKQEQGNVTADWDQPESGTRRQEETKSSRN
jgi:hypothetical protein